MTPTEIATVIGLGVGAAIAGAMKYRQGRKGPVEEATPSLNIMTRGLLGDQDARQIVLAFQHLALVVQELVAVLKARLTPEELKALKLLEDEAEKERDFERRIDEKLAELARRERR